MAHGGSTENGVNDLKTKVFSHMKSGFSAGAKEENANSKESGDTFDSKKDEATAKMEEDSRANHAESLTHNSTNSNVKSTHIKDDLD